MAQYEEAFPKIDIEYNPLELLFFKKFAQGFGAIAIVKKLTEQTEELDTVTLNAGLGILLLSIPLPKPKN